MTHDRTFPYPPPVMNEEKNIVPNSSGRKKKPQKGDDAQLAEHINKILLGRKDPLPIALSDRHPDRPNTSRIDIPAFSPVPLLTESRSNRLEKQRRGQTVDSAGPSQTVSKESRVSDTLEHIETYEDLNHQLDRYTKLLENAEKHQYSVRPGTYERVRSEYSEKRSSLKKRREEQSVLLQKELQRFLQEQSRLKKICVEQKDRIEEIAFRVSVGEFPEDQIQPEKKELEQKLLSHKTDLAEIDRILSRAVQTGLLQETGGPDKRDDPNQGETVGGVTAPRFWPWKK